MPWNLAFVDKAQKLEIFFLKNFGSSFHEPRDRNQIWAVWICIDLLLFIYNCPSFISFNYMTDIVGDFFGIRNFRLPWDSVVIFLKRFELLPPYSFISGNFNFEPRGNFEVSFEQSNRVHISFPEFFIQFNCQRSGKYLDIRIFHTSQFHEQGSILLLCWIQKALSIQCVFF